MRNTTPSNCVYYYDPSANRYMAATLVPAYLGGTAKTLAALRDEVTKMGFYAVVGSTSIGPPDDAPESR